MVIDPRRIRETVAFLIFFILIVEAVTVLTHQLKYLLARLLFILSLKHVMGSFSLYKFSLYIFQYN